MATEYSRYITASHSFRDKYFALPGDMNNAQSFWGIMTNCGVASPSGTGTQTCNGNGNGLFNGASAASRTAETFMFWQHLANAGLIEGNYSGIAGSGSSHNVVFGENVPASKASNAGWYSIDTAFSGNGAFSDNYYRNMMVLGALSDWTYGVAFAPEEVWNIDTKLDDGLPQKGKIWAVRWSTCTTAASSADLTGAYKLNVSGKQCAIAFLSSL